MIALSPSFIHQACKIKKNNTSISISWFVSWLATRSFHLQKANDLYFAPLLSATNKDREEPLSQVSRIVWAALLAFVIWISRMTLQLALV